jgi:hypothetical protein
MSPIANVRINSNFLKVWKGQRRRYAATVPYFLYLHQAKTGNASIAFVISSDGCTLSSSSPAKYC